MPSMPDVGNRFVAILALLLIAGGLLATGQIEPDHTILMTIVGGIIGLGNGNAKNFKEPNE